MSNKINSQEINFFVHSGEMSRNSNTNKKCIIQKIIESYPEPQQSQIKEIIENRNKYTALAALKIVRQTNIKVGSEHTLKAHRRQECICHI